MVPKAHSLEHIFNKHHTVFSMSKNKTKQKNRLSKKHISNRKYSPYETSDTNKHPHVKYTNIAT